MTAIIKNHNYIYELRKTNGQKLKVLMYTSFSEKTFGTFTWVKMDEPSIEGLKLALQDGDVSVNRNMSDNPNKLPPFTS